MSFGGPGGSGWEATPDSPEKKFREWVHRETGVIRREWPSFIAIEYPNGGGCYRGKGGGLLTLAKDGTVEVFPSFDGTLGTLHGSGRRKHPVTIPQGKREKPRLPDEAAFVAAIRGRFLLPEGAAQDFCDLPGSDEVGVRSIPGVSDAAGSEDAAELVRRFESEAYELLKAIIRGDSDKLRRLAQWVDFDEKIRVGSVRPTETLFDLAEAIREAAITAKGLPTREQVRTAYNALAGSNRGKADIREDLARVGFGWLPAPPGKPGTKAGVKRK